MANEPATILGNAVSHEFLTGKMSDYSDGNRTSEDDISDWIKDCIEKASRNMIANPRLKKSFETMSSGNSKVFVEIYREESVDKFTVFTTVAQNYKSRFDTGVTLK